MKAALVQQQADQQDEIAQKSLAHTKDLKNQLYKLNEDNEFEDECHLLSYTFKNKDKSGGIFEQFNETIQQDM